MSQPKIPKGKRLYLINRDFQLRYTRLAVVVGIVSTVLTLFLVLFPLFWFRIIRYPNFVPVPFLWAIAVAAVLNVLIVAFLGIVITHRIAGPMFSLVRHIRLIQTGRLTPPLKVREGDDLKYVVRNFNELLQYLHDRTAQDKARVEAIAHEVRAAGGLASALALTEALMAELTDRLEPRAEPTGEGARPA